MQSAMVKNDSVGDNNGHVIQVIIPYSKYGSHHLLQHLAMKRMVVDKPDLFTSIRCQIPSLLQKMHATLSVESSLHSSNTFQFAEKKAQCVIYPPHLAAK